ncbi:hypothetical protein NC652_005527 [Populus alba x Populus x berolinensis]|uniref:Uncharacterized protein n=1 Tax=Populus alba x Populus x berolinensis TaxID=444605 RepID=A0AAD6RC30_9ROSI|nr:hypothetical protein NC652_005527 [Populus alba x Populus x berolinensis]KAJ7006195.1 hypothetical protein NC653_005523 [Populus alba x Populus x berolinensis]
MVTALTYAVRVSLPNKLNSITKLLLLAAKHLNHCKKNNGLLRQPTLDI